LAGVGYVKPGPPDPIRPQELTPAGQAAYAKVFAASRDRISQLCAGWHPELHPRLLELLSEITHELAASTERPGRDLEAVGG
jgi:hypothetical protein